MKWIALIALLSGCAGAVEPSVETAALPDGRQLHSVKCSQSATGCLNTAAATCGGTYQAVNSESHAGGVFADVIPGPVTWYTMQFVCGPSDGAIPTFPATGMSFAQYLLAVQALKPQPSTQPYPTITNCQAVGGNLVTCTSF